jgi:hypothetical protein
MIPSPYKLQVKPYIAGAKDDFNNPIDSWGPGRDWWVRSVDPVSNREPQQPNRDMATIAYVIQADKTDAMPGYRDLVTVDGVDYPVDGQPDDWTRGPWANPVAGVTVYLKRVEG